MDEGPWQNFGVLQVDSPILSSSCVAVSCTTDPRVYGTSHMVNLPGYEVDADSLMVDEHKKTFTLEASKMNPVGADRSHLHIHQVGVAMIMVSFPQQSLHFLSRGATRGTACPVCRKR